MTKKILKYIPVNYVSLQTFVFRTLAFSCFFLLLLLPQHLVIKRLLKRKKKFWIVNVLHKMAALDWKITTQNKN